MLNNAMTTEKLVRIQYVGLVPGVAAADLKAGDITVWNGGYRYRVEAVKAVSAKFVSITMVELKWTAGGDVEGKTWERRSRADHLIAVSKLAEVA